MRANHAEEAIPIVATLGGIGEAFADRNFRIYSVGGIVSWLSFFVQMVAVSWTTWELTHSTTWLAIVALLDIAPNIVFLPLGGVLADRCDRFRIVVITHILALFQSLALTVLAYDGQLTIGLIAVLAFLHGLIHSFSAPGLFGMLPRFVDRERLASAIAVSSAYTQFAIFAGPALAGWLILHFGVATAFATNVFGYFFYLCSIAFLRTPTDFRAPVASGRSVVGDLLDGARYILGHPGISALLLLMLMGDALSSSVYQMLPAYADGILGMGVEGVSSLMAAAGFGATLSALWLAQGGARRATPRRVLWAFLAFTLAVSCVMLVQSLIPAVLAMIVFGIAGEMRRTGTVSLLQMSVRDERRGRVMATQFLLQRVAGGIGVSVVGAVAEHHGLRAPMLIAAGLALLAWAIAFRGRARILAAFAPDPTALTTGQAAAETY
ncbi:MAG TPA: MFS transporter [Stellaceae bacterium]|nr:MFS transporter [Stellaceae bacterium]